MNDLTPLVPRPRLWCLIALLLLAWNGAAAFWANGLVMTQRWDGTQYQLLARNRLHGHFEVGDQGDTVRSEGRHPMFRPALVWIEETLAPVVGSVRRAAGIASAVAVTLLELALLWLGWGCFGRMTAVAILAGLFLPLTVSALLLHLAVGQGPEPWASAAVLWGLAALVEAWRRGDVRWALAAGAIAGLAEWFRTGSHLLFLIPCAVYGLACLRDRQWRGCLRPTAAVFVFFAVATLGGLGVPSTLDKTTMNFWHRLIECQGLQLTQEIPGERPVTILMGGLAIAPGTDEVWYDHIVQQSRGIPVRRFLAEHGDVILGTYLNSLKRLVTSGAWGLRLMIGELLLACFFAQLLLSFRGRKPQELYSLAFGGAALAQYLGPVVLFRGADPTHYLLVPMPLFLLVGAHGVVRVAQFLWEAGGRVLPTATAVIGMARPWAVPIGVAGIALLAVPFYWGAMTRMRQLHAAAEREQAAVDALHLDGRRVACRDMNWFVDRNVETMLFPYATVPQLERYARAHDLDGFLVWTEAQEVVFRDLPYVSLNEFDRAMRTSPAFEQPVASGTWRWYPVRRQEQVRASARAGGKG